jgi:allantoin racemase
MATTVTTPQHGITRPAHLKPRLIWLEATEGKPELSGLWSFLRSYLDGLAATDYSIELRHFPRGAGGVRHPSTRLANDAIALAAAELAAPDADLLVFGCWATPTIEARALVDVPLTGLTEASVRLGPLFAFRPAIVTVAEGLRMSYERDIAQFGATRSLLDPPVWWLEPPSSHEDVLEAIESPGSLIDRFDSVAHRAIDAGADAILVGCGYFGPLFTVHGYTHVSQRPDVPVLDCCLLAYQLGSALLNLHRLGVDPSQRAYPPVPLASSEPLRTALARVRGQST